MIDHDPDHLERRTSDSWEYQYLALLDDILCNGDDRVDRTGVGTRAVFGKHLDIDLRKGFPAATTKKLAWKAIVSELLWFLEGSSDERRLAEILHGTRDADKKTIWTENAQASYWKPKAAFDGDLGPVYGVQWRSWKFNRVRSYRDYISHTGPGEPKTFYNATVLEDSIDQVAELVKKLKTNPTDRRMIISAWNVADLSAVALPPCHMMAQFFVEQERLSCSMYQRSVDTMLGLPFNIASYALLTHILARVSGLHVGRLIMNLGDTHLYMNHLGGAREQLMRKPYKAPDLFIADRGQDIDSFKMEDFELIGYQSHAAIKLDMAV